MHASRRMVTALALSVASLPLNGCSSSNPTGPGAEDYNPDIPTAWAPAITNPYFPLLPGYVWEYESETEDGLETILTEVLEDTRMIMGVEAMIVHDRVFLEGDLIEDTFDWYAQALNGDIWYLGEDTEEIENGMVVSTGGSFEWGIDGALPGIIMWGDPAAHLNETYRQEFYRGEAEDWGRVIRVGESITAPFGSYGNCIVTDDWNGLEPGTLENKTYCPGVGFVYETIVQGGSQQVWLVDHQTP